MTGRTEKRKLKQQAELKRSRNTLKKKLKPKRKWKILKKEEKTVKGNENSLLRINKKI